MRLFEVIDPDQTAQSVADFLRGKGHYRYGGYPKLLEDEAVFGMVRSPVGDIWSVKSGQLNHEKLNFARCVAEG